MYLLNVMYLGLRPCPLCTPVGTFCFLPKIIDRSYMVRTKGLEPTVVRILSPMRLPIPPRAQILLGLTGLPELAHCLCNVYPERGHRFPRRLWMCVDLCQGPTAIVVQVIAGMLARLT